jgi:hypothetical protein
MKEIFHNDNQNLDAANKIRTEADDLGFADSYIGYGDVSVLL